MDSMTHFNLAQGMARDLEKVFPRGGARAAIETTRVEAYEGIEGPADLLRLMAGSIDDTSVVEAEAEPDEPEEVSLDG